MVTKFPFFLKQRIKGEEISTELWAEMEKIAGRYDLGIGKMGARIEFLPDPTVPGTHFLHCVIEYYGDKKIRT